MYKKKKKCKETDPVEMTWGRHCRSFLTQALQLYIHILHGHTRDTFFNWSEWKDPALGKNYTRLICSNKQLNFLLLNKNQNWHCEKPENIKSWTVFSWGWLIFFRRFWWSWGRSLFWFPQCQEKTLLWKTCYKLDKSFFRFQFQFVSIEIFWALGAALDGSKLTSL